MSLIDKVIESDRFRSHADKLKGDELASLEESVREMLSSAERIYSILRLRSSDQKGREELAESLEHLLTYEGQEEWRQDKN